MNLGELLEKTLPPMGYELVDWESSPKGRYVRVFIDKPGGITVEDCATVSHHLTRRLRGRGVRLRPAGGVVAGAGPAAQKAGGFRALRGRGRLGAAGAPARTRGA